MRIAFDALNIRHGGGLTVLSRLAQAFAATGHETHVITSTAAVAESLRDEARIRPHVVRGANNALAAQLFRHRRWEALMREIGAEAVFGFNYRTPTSLPQVTYHINVIPLLPFDQRRAAVGIYRAVLQAHYAKSALRRSNLNLFESEHILALARTASGQIANPLVRYIGIDIPDDNISARSPQKTIVAVTSGARHKHNELLFALHRTLRPHGIGLRLVGLSSAELDVSDEMRAEKDYALAQSDIVFVGYCDRVRLYEELRTALALVSFSELESFFMVPVEAMSVGCPAIVTDTSSVRESVGDAGLLIAPGNVEQAAAHVLALLDRSTRTAVAERGRAWSARFDAKTCAREIVAAVETALA